MSIGVYYCAFPQLLPTFTTLRPVIAIWVYLTMLAPMVQDLGAVYSDLCGGHLGFVWSVDKRHVVHFARTQGDVFSSCPGVAINKQKWWFSILRTEKVVYAAKIVIQWWFHQRKRWFNQVKRWLNQLEPWFNRDILVMRWFNGRYILWAIGPKNKFNERNLQCGTL